MQCFCEFHLNNLMKLMAIISIISCRETAGMDILQGLFAAIAMLFRITYSS